MKKLLTLSAILAATLLSAQIDFSSTRYGITAGPNYSRVQNAHNPSGPRYAFYAGVLALIPVDDNNQFYIQPEVLYVAAGESGKDKYYKDKPGKGYDAMYICNYISVPINFKGYFSEAESEFFAFGGPRFDFLIAQNVKNAVNPDYEKDTYGKAGSFNFNLGVGLGYSYKRQLELSVKYDIGLSNAYPDLKNSPIDIANGLAGGSKKKSQQILSVGLSYIFQ